MYPAVLASCDVWASGCWVSGNLGLAFPSRPRHGAEPRPPDNTAQCVQSRRERPSGPRWSPARPSLMAGRKWESPADVRSEKTKSHCEPVTIRSSSGVTSCLHNFPNFSVTHSPTLLLVTMNIYVLSLNMVVLGVLCSRSRNDPEVDNYVLF